MSKVLYCFKIWLFRDQFNLTKVEEIGIREICLFCSLFYVRSWMKCSLLTEAPRRDLQFMKQLLEYKTISPAVSKAASEKLSNHMWYLSEELVALAFLTSPWLWQPSGRWSILLKKYQIQQPWNVPNLTSGWQRKTIWMTLYQKIHRSFFFNYTFLSNSFLMTQPVGQTELIIKQQKKQFSLWKSLTRIEPAYGIFVLGFQPKKQQFSVALPMP